MSNNDILTIFISRWAIYILILISLAIIIGYLWNYFIIKELREMNRNLHQDLNRMMDVIAHSRGSVQGPYINNQPVNNPVDQENNIQMGGRQ